MMQEFTEDQVVMLMDEYDTNILDPLKENIAVTSFKLFPNEIEKKYAEQLNKINYEINLNIDISQTYSYEDIMDGDEVLIEYIKICTRRYKIVAFNFQITERDWRMLKHCLKIKNNKILGLDFQ